MEKLGDKKGLLKVIELEKRFPCYNAVHRMGAETRQRGARQSERSC